MCVGEERMANLDKMSSGKEIRCGLYMLFPFLERAFLTYLEISNYTSQGSTIVFFRKLSLIHSSEDILYGLMASYSQGKSKNIYLSHTIIYLLAIMG